MLIKFEAGGVKWFLQMLSEFIVFPVCYFTAHPGKAMTHFVLIQWSHFVENSFLWDDGVLCFIFIEIKTYLW